MGFARFTFGNDVCFAQFNFDYFLQIKAVVDRDIWPVFVLAEGLAFCLTPTLLGTEEMDLFADFSIVRPVFGGRLKQVAEQVHQEFTTKINFDQ